MWNLWTSLGISLFGLMAFANIGRVPSRSIRTFTSAIRSFCPWVFREPATSPGFRRLFTTRQSCHLVRARRSPTVVFHTGGFRIPLFPQPPQAIAEQTPAWSSGFQIRQDVEDSTLSTIVESPVDSIEKCMSWWMSARRGVKASPVDTVLSSAFVRATPCLGCGCLGG